MMSASLDGADFLQNKKLFLEEPAELSLSVKMYPVAVHFMQVNLEDYVDAAAKQVL